MRLKRRSLRHDLQARVDHQTPRAFDFEGSRWPPQFHYTGPFHDGAGRAEVDFPWDRLTGEPLIYGSMGTLMNGLVDVYRTITAAPRSERRCNSCCQSAISSIPNKSD